MVRWFFLSFAFPYRLRTIKRRKKATKLNVFAAQVLAKIANVTRIVPNARIAGKTSKVGIAGSARTVRTARIARTAPIAGIAAARDALVATNSLEKRTVAGEDPEKGSIRRLCEFVSLPR